MTDLRNYNLTTDQVADLRDGGNLVVESATGRVQLCGPGGFAIEFADATNVYVSTAELDRLEQGGER